jgi:CheY-like chemotaxis protein/HPt (histidine-containing phosphotransfer) domain-containing protein
MQSTYLGHIQDSGKHLLELINDILDLSKLEAGKLDLNLSPCSLAELCQASLQMVSAQAAAKNMHSSFTMEPQTIQLNADARQIKQILLNLLGNAIKFTERGEVRLTIVREGDQALFQVADTGLGISQEHLGRLFRPFEQADNSTTRIYGGTGLGLKISRDFAILMGGEISVKSALGQGSEFTLRLPLPEGVPDIEDPAQILPDSGPYLTGLRVLIADDVHLNRVILEDLITGQGATAVFAANGRLAVDQVREHGAAGFDIVLMDVQMPVMDGYEATRCIHRLAPELPVIGITAHAMQDERERCLAAGMADHVPKPIDSDTLIMAILAGVGRQRRNSGAAGPAMPSPPDRPAALDVEAGLPLIDWAALSARYSHRQDFIRKLLAVSLETHSESPEGLRVAARSEDHAAIRSLAHALRGIAGNLGADRIAAFAKQTEASASGEFGDSWALAEELASQVDDLLATLRNQLEKAIIG